ncbi:N-acetyltransferase [Fischerella thermalis WC559]|uniref:N-acetyltransferase domain-containing protein n=1 Tax=Fischerella thermalis JSC-11 TaxID=741277 RepID=G6FP14_9CYAN|nr:hypothetical protein FJSC11DRAFT_0594 [Fischerella thermalis JSC-11]PLZ07135.1 N-acetyltransferase [Fischerella thermalis WC114]PLZ10358.1 N-acetyltransferase [Fischerella thermalis WC119]PLZ17333.1 N-acetyltransferase [Fischerella thermalis WC157]PLZ17786.1 N-acetyltransferase [Fischerella thermalis WC341]PLZ33941.1 N-acetyltransferase [Fischerella thermalis WC559]PLZ35196.1 N-acetyltransferase [Fischerella thermalis WC558]PLZ48175.1 N-acetyltransferase [Fischerella thermalis WC442]PLZ4
MPEIETARLRLRPYTLDDVDETAVILSNPEAMKYSPREPIPQDQVKEATQQILEFFIQHWKHSTNFNFWCPTPVLRTWLRNRSNLRCA